MSEADPRLGPFEPDPSSHSGNGARLSRRRRLVSGGGIVFGVLVGAIVAVSIVGRIAWLNLSNAQVAPWTRPVIAAGLAGVMVSGWRREHLGAATVGGAIAALLALWGVYAIVRLSSPVIFVERSIVRVVTFDLLRLGAYALPAGASGAAVPVLVRSLTDRVGDRRRVARR